MANETMSGIVAILNDDGTFKELRDLGPTPVGVKIGSVLPTSGTPPDVTAGYILSDPTYTVSPSEVVISWTLIALPLDDLPAWKFRAQLAIAGLTDAVTAAVGTISDPSAKAVAIAKLEYSTTFQRVDPLFSNADLLSALHMTSADIDTLWRAALALE